MESSIKQFVLGELDRKEFSCNMIKIVDMFKELDYSNKVIIDVVNQHQINRIDSKIGEYITKSDCNEVLCSQYVYEIRDEHEVGGKMIREVSFYCFSGQQLILFCEELLKAVQSGRHYLKPISNTAKGEWDENDLV